MFTKFFFTGALCGICLFPALADTQQREAVAVRVEEAPKVDGRLNEPMYQQVSKVFDGVFTQIQPNNLEPSEAQSEVWLVYTDFGVYVSARLHDEDPGSIPRELGIRDDMDRNTDIFTFALDPYQNGQNGFHFLVTAAGVQGDSYITNQGNEDFGWDAVWNSAVTITDDGWVVEMEIPYSAIRFPNQPAQEWNINFARRRAAKQEIATWNPVDNAQNGFVPQFGRLTGIKDITPPPRIFFTPYVTTYATLDGSTNTFGANISGGLDLKAGLNESFTLDMILIPDFGQVRADNQVLNLGPFEVRFQERRPFFTEGTELFNQGPMFYSRRVGQSVRVLDPEFTANDNTYEVLASPREAPLLNATKVSGRTPDGWGIGFFNAVTRPTQATVLDYILDENALAMGDSVYVPGDTIQVGVDPWVNYNVLVGEKTFGYNSKVTVINTNVTRFNYNNDANATRANLSYFLDEKNTYQINATGTFSRVRRAENLINGYAYFIGFNKVAGNFQFSASRNVESADLQLNDFGFLNAPNEVSHRAQISLNKFKPWWVFNNFRWGMSGNLGQMWDDRQFTNRGINSSMGGQLKNFWWVEAWGSVRPFHDRDYFGTFTAGRYLTMAPSWDFGGFIGTDDRKVVALRTYNYTWHRPEWNAHDWGGGGNVRVRVSNNLNFNWGLDYQIQGNQRGFTTRWEDAMGESQIIYGIRDWRSLENSFRAAYTFNNKMGINLEVRHYWAQVQNKAMRQLSADGDLVQTAYDPTRYEYQLDNGETFVTSEEVTNGNLVRTFNAHDVNFNAFNVYLTYNWQIGPGSFVRVVYQDVLNTGNDDAYMQFGPNFKNAISGPHQQNLSVRLIYFLDYLSVKKWF